MDLIIDTSSEKLKLILNNNGTIKESVETNQKHLKHLLPEIENILNESAKKLNDISTFSVVVGPGSFTGVRIGVSTIKAFGCVLKNKKYIGLNMLELLSFVVSKYENIKSNFYCIIKSTSTKYYFCLSNKNGKVLNSSLVTDLELKEILQENNFPLYSYNCDSILNSININLLTEYYIAFNNLKKAEKCFVTIDNLKPIYLALSQAEEELNKRLANENKNN